MTDVVERLRFKTELKTPEDVHVLFADAADEIERLRAALREIACSDGSCGCDIRKERNDECMHGIARAALEEEK